MTIGLDIPPTFALQARFFPSGDQSVGRLVSREIPSCSGPRHRYQSLAWADEEITPSEAAATVVKSQLRKRVVFMFCLSRKVDESAIRQRRIAGRGCQARQAASYGNPRILFKWGIISGKLERLTGSAFTGHSITLRQSGRRIVVSVSYTHLTLPTIYSV